MNTHYEYITTVGSLTGVVRYITNGVLWGISCHRHRYIIYDDSICRHIKPYVDVCIWANAVYCFAWTTLRADEHFVFEFDALTRHHGRTHGYISRRLQIFPTSCPEQTLKNDKIIIFNCATCLYIWCPQYGHVRSHCLKKFHSNVLYAGVYKNCYWN